MHKTIMNFREHIKHDIEVQLSDLSKPSLFQKRYQTLCHEEPRSKIQAGERKDKCWRESGGRCQFMC